MMADMTATLSRLARRDFLPCNQLVSVCKDFLVHVRQILTGARGSWDDYDDDTSRGKTASRDLRLEPAFVRNFAAALLHGGREGSGLFEIAASPALSNLTEAFARMLLDNPAAQDLAASSSPSMIEALHLVMTSRNKEAIGWAAMAMSQLAIRRPETAISIASLQGMTATLSQVLNESGPNGTGYHSSEENRCVRDNTALLVNNVAAIGGEEAVRVLCSCKSLVAILVDLLALHNDGPVVLKRFVGCFNHLSRSNKSAQMLRRERVLGALQKVMLSARTQSGVGSWQACDALATMALANLIGKEVDEEIYAPDQGLGGLSVGQYKKAVAAASDPDAVLSVVIFLKQTMRRERVHGISLRVYDVLFPLNQLSRNGRNHKTLTEAGLIELISEIVSTWAPGLYSAQFSAVRGSNYPVLECGCEILEHLSRYRPALRLMVELDLEGICERLIRNHTDVVKQHAAKVLWRIRDREAMLVKLNAVIEGVDLMKSVSVHYAWSEAERNMRVKGLIHEENMAESLHNALQWLHTNMDSDVLTKIRNMLVGMDKKSLGLVFSTLHKLIQRRKMLRRVTVSKWRQRHVRSTEQRFDQWLEFTEENKRKKTSILGKWLHRNFAISFARWIQVVDINKRLKKVMAKILFRWTNQSLSSAFVSFKEHLLQRKKMQQVSAKVIGHLKNRTLSVAFDTWHKNSAVADHIRMLCRRIVKRMLNGKLAGAFQSWREHSTEQKRMEDVCFKVIKHMMNRRLSVAFDTWNEHAREQSRMEYICSKIVKRMLNGKLAGAFQSWREHSTEQKRMEDVCFKVIKHMMNRRLSVAFDTWNEHAREQSRMEYICSKIVKRMLNGKLAGAFQSWREHSTEQKRMEDVCFKVIKHMMNRRLSVAFDTWNEHAREQSRMEYICSKIVKRMLNGKLASALNLWSYHVSFFLRQKAILSRCLKRLQHLVLNRAFALWISHLHDVSSQHEQAGAVLKMWRHAGRHFGTCLECGGPKDLRMDSFKRWSSIALHFKEVRQHVFDIWTGEQEELCTRVIQIFDTLKKHVRARRKNSQHAANLVVRNLARASRMKCLNAWKEYAMKPLLWIKEDDDFDLHLTDIKFSVPQIPAHYHNHTQFGEDLTKDLTRALGAPDVGIELLYWEDKSVTFRLDFENSCADEDADAIVVRIQDQVRDPTSLLRNSHAGSALESVEVLIYDGSEFHLDQDDDEEYESMAKGRGKAAQMSASKTLQIPQHVELNSHSSVDISKMEMVARIAALRLQCKSLEKQVAKYKECKGPFAWCHVGINLTRSAPHIVTGEIKARDINGKTQYEDGYVNPIIYPGDRLISIDDWHLEHESIEMVKTALRGVVHSPTTLKFCRSVARHNHPGGGHNDTDVFDFTYEVKLLRMLPGASVALEDKTVSANFYGFNALQQAVNRTLGTDDVGTPRPEWSKSPASKMWTMGSIPRARQAREDSSQSMADWLSEGDKKKSNKLILADVPGVFTSRPVRSQVSGAQEIRPSTPSAFPIDMASRNLLFTEGDGPLSKIIADIVDPESPRACETADPWMLVA